MRKFSVEKQEAGWVALDVRGNIISGPHPEEWQARLYGTHAACAKPLFSALGFKPVNTGNNYRAWQARPFYGIKATIMHHPKIGWMANVEVDENSMDARAETFRTRAEAASWVNTFGDGMVMTRNILNPDAGEFPIARRDKGGCTDPGTERYHSM